MARDPTRHFQQPRRRSGATRRRPSAEVGGVVSTEEDGHDRHLGLAQHDSRGRHPDPRPAIQSLTMTGPTRAGLCGPSGPSRRGNSYAISDLRSKSAIVAWRMFETYEFSLIATYRSPTEFLQIFHEKQFKLFTVGDILKRRSKQPFSGPASRHVSVRTVERVSPRGAHNTGA